MKKELNILLGFFLLIAAPIAGGLIRGLPGGFFQYPPLVQVSMIRGPVSMVAVVVFAVFLLLALGFIMWPESFGFHLRGPVQSRPRAVDVPEADDSAEPKGVPLPAVRSLPGWGWMGCVLLAVGWVVAWTRLGALSEIRHYSFVLLWLGYIFLVDGWVYKRRGISLLSAFSGVFWTMFGVSVLMWWYFEYVNRFIRNWYYVGIGHFSAEEYVVYASLCFSTVIPAIFETACLLMSWPHFQNAYRAGMPLKERSEVYAFGMTCLGVLGLFLLGLFPDSFFYLMWISPLVILAGVLWLSQLKQPFRRVLEGDFSVLVAMAVASLCCGVLWECWNWLSMPQWRYSIPRVNVMHIFEMPLVGYGGYLPFGVICWLTWQSFSYLFSKRMAVKMRRIETVFFDEPEAEEN